MRHLLFTGSLLLILYGATPAVGQTVSNFSLENATSGSVYSLGSDRNSEAVVLIFTSNYCPYAKLYDNRVAGLVNEYSSGEVQFVMINPNNPQRTAKESKANMVKKVQRMGVSVPYLMDYDQKIADLFGVRKVPEAFVLKNIRGSFVTVYNGAIDDNPQVASDVSKHYLQQAIDAVLGNRPVKMKETRPTGCLIKR
jgi:thiol-disulfide isomerase/thioredoxin